MNARASVFAMLLLLAPLSAVARSASTIGLPMTDFFRATVTRVSPAAKWPRSAPSSRRSSLNTGTTILLSTRSPCSRRTTRSRGVNVRGHWQSDVLVGAGVGVAWGLWAHRRPSPVIMGILPGHGFMAGYADRF
jgi:hypothetical protein